METELYIYDKRAMYIYEMRGLDMCRPCVRQTRKTSNSRDLSIYEKRPV